MRRNIPVSQAVYYIDRVKGMEEKGIRQHWEQDLLPRNYCCPHLRSMDLRLFPQQAQATDWDLSHHILTLLPVIEINIHWNRNWTHVSPSLWML